MDLDGAVYHTWDELRVYCHRVASVVGLISIEIFGYSDPRARQYAEELGTMVEDMIKLLEAKVQPSLRRGKPVDRETGKRIATIMRAIASDLEG